MYRWISIAWTSEDHDYTLESLRVNLLSYKDKKNWDLDFTSKDQDLWEIEVLAIKCHLYAFDQMWKTTYNEILDQNDWLYCKI